MVGTLYDFGQTKVLCTPIVASVKRTNEQTTGRKSGMKTNERNLATIQRKQDDRYLV